MGAAFIVLLLAVFALFFMATSSRVDTWLDPKLAAPDDAGSARGIAPIQQEEEAISEELLSRQKRYALVIGNSLYTNGFPGLAGVVEDLKVLPETLEKAGFSVVVRSNLDSDALEREVQSFIDEFGAEANNQLLIYFASHGATDDNKTGYIVPVDAPPYTTNPVEFRRKAMSMNMLEAIAKDAIARHVLFVFDSCFAGTIFEGRRSATRTIREGFDKPTRFFITAGGADEPVLDRSVFRDQFVRGLLGAADRDEDGFIRDVELGDFLATAVYEDEHAPHRPRWGWLNDAKFDKGVWAIPVPGSFRSVETPGLTLGAQAFFDRKADEAETIWTQYALAGDVRVMKNLGDYFSDAALEELGLTDAPSTLIPGLKADNAQAMAWYARVIAWYVERDRHDVFYSDDRLLRQSLRAFTVLRANSSSADVSLALAQTENMLERGDVSGLYSLGLAYLVGMPFDYDLRKGMVYLKLAADRNLDSALRDFEARTGLLSRQDAIEIEDRTAHWRPPLPGAYAGTAQQQTELERLRLELEQVQKERALALVDDIDIDIIKRLLRSLGHYDGPIDNETGPALREGVRRFQQSLASDNLTEEEKEAMRTGVLTPTQTVELVKRSAATGYPMGAYVFGIMYYRGIGVAPDGALALKWLTVAADADLALGHYALGFVYRDGADGTNPVAPDKNKAAHHFKRAAALGYVPAERALAELTEAPTLVE